jgi:hypothetical protein
VENAAHQLLVAWPDVDVSNGDLRSLMPSTNTNDSATSGNCGSCGVGCGTPTIHEATGYQVDTYRGQQQHRFVGQHLQQLSLAADLAVG